MSWVAVNHKVCSRESGGWGSRVVSPPFFVRCGGVCPGIVMSGVFDSNPYAQAGGADNEGQLFCMDLLPNVMLNPLRAPMVTLEELESAIPTFNWRGGPSGRLLTQAEAAALERLWSAFIAAHAEEADGWVLNMATMR